MKEGTHVDLELPTIQRSIMQTCKNLKTQVWNSEARSVLKPEIWQSTMHNMGVDEPSLGWYLECKTQMAEDKIQGNF